MPGGVAGVPGVMIRGPYADPSVRQTKPMRQRGSLSHLRGSDVAARRRWNWLHFICGFLPVAFFVFFDTRMPFFPEFWPHVAETIVLSCVGGGLVATFGESAFEVIARW